MRRMQFLAVLDPRRRFSETASNYDRHRPQYPESIFRWMISTARLTAPSRIADIGCGTGIATRAWMNCGFDVVGIDPNPEMLDRARAHGGNYQHGEATHTGLSENSVDLVSVAQAFHWFEVPPTMTEFGRILRKDGWCAAFWNLRIKTPFMEEYDALLGSTGDYASVPKPRSKIEEIEAYPHIRDRCAATFENHQRLDRDGFTGRVYSSSYVVHGIQDPPTFERQLDALFLRYQREGCVEFAYETVGRMWRFQPSSIE